MKFNQKKFINILQLIMSVVGLVFFVVGMFFLISLASFKSHSVTTEATVISKDRQYSRSSNESTRYIVIVKYSYNGVQYENRLGENTNLMREGDSINILVDTKNPNNIVYPNVRMILGVVFSLAGIILLIAMIIFRISIIRKNKIKKLLLEQGQKIYADITDIQINSRIKANGKSPYQITCTWKNPRDSKLYYFLSDNIWFNPSIVIKESNITKLPVYINLDDLSNYVLVIDEIENKVGNF